MAESGSTPIVSLDDSTRVKLPLRWIVSVSAALVVLGGVLTLVRLHAGDEVRHLDAKTVVAKGGPVYREDLRDVRDALDQRIRQEGEQTRAAVRALPAPRPLRCRSVARGELLCAFE